MSHLFLRQNTEDIFHRIGFTHNFCVVLSGRSSDQTDKRIQHNIVFAKKNSKNRINRHKLDVLKPNTEQIDLLFHIAETNH